MDNIVSATELGRSHERHLQPVFFPSFFDIKILTQTIEIFIKFTLPKKNQKTKKTNPQFFCQKKEIWWKIKSDWLDCWILLTCKYYCDMNNNKLLFL